VTEIVGRGAAGAGRGASGAGGGAGANRGGTGPNRLAASNRAAKPARRPAYECDVCGHRPPKWLGRCPECGEWGSVVDSTGDVAPAALRSITARTPLEPARPIASISVEPARAKPTGVGELDRVLGGGIVPGAVVLLAGEPGVGKSTLLLDVAQQWAAAGESPSLVISGEESTSQVRLRAERLGALHERLYLAAETDLEAVISTRSSPDFSSSIRCRPSRRPAPKASRAVSHKSAP
jgi:DNA repair protein RadA/Sms